MKLAWTSDLDYIELFYHSKQHQNYDHLSSPIDIENQSRKRVISCDSKIITQNTKPTKKEGSRSYL